MLFFFLIHRFAQSIFLPHLLLEKLSLNPVSTATSLVTTPKQQWAKGCGHKSSVWF